MALTLANVVIGTGSDSAEEDDVLNRSRKKVRVGEANMLNDNTVIPRKEDWMSEKISSVQMILLRLFLKNPIGVCVSMMNRV